MKKGVIRALKLSFLHNIHPHAALCTYLHKVVALVVIHIGVGQR